MQEILFERKKKLFYCKVGWMLEYDTWGGCEVPILEIIKTQLDMALSSLL